MTYEPELKGIISDIIHKFLNFLNNNKLKDFVYNMVEKKYNEGIEVAEVKFNRNFIPNYQTVSFIQKFAFDNVTNVSEEMKDKLRKEMALGLMNGESISSLKLRIMDVMDTTIQRAEMITRTESVRAFNMGNFQAAKDSGLELSKKWSAREDERECETCGYLDEQIVGMDEKFKTQSGEEYLLSPAHPNCRCRILYIQPHSKY